MPRKKIAVKSHANTSLVRIRENSRLMETHESMVDYLSGRTSVSSFMNVFAPNFFGLNFLNPLEGDIIYSDEDDDYDDDEDEDDDEDDDDCFPRGATDGPLEPHPQIKQLTDEEADQFGKELLLEEERRKDKSEKNKRKKKRKKEKKRLEKEKAVQDNLPEEEQTKCDSSEKQSESTTIERDPGDGDKSQHAIEAAEGGENKSDAGKRKEMKTEEEKKDSDLENSHASSNKSEPEESRRNPKPATEQGKEKSASIKVERPKETKPDAEKTAVLKEEEEEKTPINKEKKVDPSTDALAKKSREFANMGNRLAASGQYEMAVQYFTDAIKCNPKEFKLFGNRSLCYERIQQYENALRDADVAIAMEPGWIKGLFRKGKALSGLKRYYEASLTYQQVLELESASVEAAQELKRAQTLHLMELGFSWAQSSEALKTYATLGEAVEALFIANRHAALYASATGEPPASQDEEDGEGAWTVHQAGRSRAQQIREFGESRSHSHSPTPRSRISPKPELFPVWVGTFRPSMTYVRLYELFSRTGTVYSIKMLLEQRCAFVNYTSLDECHEAIECIDGMLVDGAPLTVRFPFKTHSDLGASKSAATDPSARSGMYKKECFFWRTTGCTRQDCTFRHVPENKNIDRDRFTSRLGSMGNQK